MAKEGKREWWKQRYERERNGKLQQAGFNVESLTDEQKNLILQPEEGPENYYQDGEISSEDAHKWWLHQLRKSGLNDIQITKAKKMNYF